ncbi:MAG: hypothetical protein Q4D93_06810 [Porphyromonas sp.]|nr:hypothetical protein [Porphyromonas sp.]
MSEQKRRRRPRKPKGPVVKQDVRKCPVTVMLSETEREMLDYFVYKYKLESRSAYIRSLVMTDVMGYLYQNNPTLFDPHPESTDTDEG